MRLFEKVLRGNTKVTLILAISLILRWILILQGGQYYFPDEARYLNSRGVAASILNGDFQEALSILTAGLEHIGYRIIATVPAIAETLFDLGPVFPAVFFSFFSVLNLFLIWMLARRSGMAPAAANYALLVAACSLSLMYYSRHLLPYDVSLSFGLFALYVGLEKEWNIRNSLATGALSFLCFVAYNGYWALAGFALLAHALFSSTGILHSLKKVLFFILGGAVSLAALTVLVLTGSTSNILSNYLEFAGSVRQGEYAEGWKLPFEYLWHAEHTILLIMAGLILVGLYSLSSTNLRRVAPWLAGGLFIYLCMAISSTLLQLFVVYGRTVRQLVPFLVLLAGFGLAQLEEKMHFGKKVSSAILMLVLLQASWNLYSAYSVTYPLEFIQKAQTRYPGFAMSEKRTNTGAPAVCQHRDYLATQVKYIYPEPESIPIIEGDLLLSNAHPLNFLPYQYEGYTPEQRQLLREEKIAMELYKIQRGNRFSISGTPVPNCVAANP